MLSSLCFSAGMQVRMPLQEMEDENGETVTVEGCDRVRFAVHVDGVEDEDMLVGALHMQRDVCGTGFFLDPNGVDCVACQPCNADFGLVRSGCMQANAGTCVQCPTGWAAADGFQCQKCLAAGIVCTDGISRPCPAGFFCAGESQQEPCEFGQYCPEGSTVERDCEAGYVCADATTRVLCEAGDLCPGGSSPRERCPAGFVCANPGDDAEECVGGSFCPEGSTVERDCEAGSFCTTPETQEPCLTPGAFCAARSETEGPRGGRRAARCHPSPRACVRACVQAQARRPLRASGASAQPIFELCRRRVVQGSWVSLAYASRPAPACERQACYPSCPRPTLACRVACASSGQCPAGYFCPTPTTKLPCAREGAYCPATRTDAAALTEGLCPVGFHCADSTSPAEPCSEGSYCPSDSAQEVPCPIGFFCTLPSDKKPCTPGSYCPPGVSSQTACEARGDAVPRAPPHPLLRPDRTPRPG